MKNTTKPKPPATLKNAALKLWHHYADELHDRQMLLSCDLAALERLCRLEVQADKLLSEIERDGAVVKDRDETPRRNPALMALQNLSGIIDSLKRSLAVGAYYRHRIGEKKEEEPQSLLLSLMRKPETGT